MKNSILFLFFFNVVSLQAQIIQGNLSAQKGAKISLTGYQYTQTETLGTTTLDSLGNFTLSYPKNYKGIGVLQTTDKASYLVLLNQKTIRLQGTHLNEIDSLQLLENDANRSLSSFIEQNTFRQKAYRALRYVQPLYKKQQQKGKVLKTLTKEITRIESADDIAIGKIEKKYPYLGWYLKQRTFINDMPASVYNYTERIPKHIAQFRQTDFTNPNFKTSGLYKELIERHYLMLEKMGQPLDSVYQQMAISTNYLLQNLKEKDSLLNTIATDLFAYFEKRSLFKAAAHLSEVLLNDDNKCVLHKKTTNTLQKYKLLKVGNDAPDIQLAATEKLSDIQQPVLLVFGASWCPHCKDEALELYKYYDDWILKSNLKVLYISIDTDKQAYTNAYKNAPWQMYCDFKGWETQAAIDYFVSATPTYILISKDKKILSHIKSLAQVTAWVTSGKLK